MNGRTLTQKEITQFRDHGILIAEDVIPAEFLDVVIDGLEGEIDRRARKLHEGELLSSIYEHDGFETRLAKISAETDQIALSMPRSITAVSG